jgi:hypothetical protein
MYCVLADTAAFHRMSVDIENAECVARIDEKTSGTSAHLPANRCT